MKFSGMCLLRFALGVTGTYRLHLLQGRLRGQSVLAVGRHLSMHTCTDDASTAITWAVLHNKLLLKDFYQKKEQSKSPY